MLYIPSKLKVRVPTDNKLINTNRVADPLN
jgi:hypothetical protein